MKDPSGSPFASQTARLVRQIGQRKRPVQGRSQVTVQAILEATFQVLRRQGLAGVTTTRVAEVAGVSVGTLYQYFPNKRSLLGALELQYFERVTGPLLAAIAAARGLPLDAALRHIIAELLAAKRANRALGLALRAPMAELGGAARVREAARQIAAGVAELLRAAVPDLARPELAVCVLVGALEGAVSAVLEDSSAILLDPALEDELIAVAAGYLAARPP